MGGRMSMRSFTIWGTPKPLQRGRIITIAGHGAIKDTKANKDRKAAIAICYRQAAPFKTVADFPTWGDAVPVSVAIHGYWSPPSPVAEHRGKPKPTGADADNIAKLILDALNGVAWADDSQVVQLAVCKWYCQKGEQPRTEVLIDSWSDTWLRRDITRELWEAKQELLALKAGDPSDTSDSPITIEWLESLGFVAVPSSMGSDYSDHYRLDGVEVWPFNDKGWLFEDFDSVLMKTQGHLKLLLQWALNQTPNLINCR